MMGGVDKSKGVTVRGKGVPYRIGDVVKNNNGDIADIIEFIKGTHTRQRRAVIEFSDGTLSTISTSKIRAGTFKNCNSPSLYGVGYIGRGIYRASHKGGTTRAYGKWEAMLRRCYCVAHPDYKGYGG